MQISPVLNPPVQSPSPPPARVAITFGDAAGIGPEVIVKAFGDADFIERHPAFVVGDAAVLRRAAARWAPALRVQAIAAPEQHRPAARELQVVDLGGVPPDLRPGRVSAAAGRAAFEAVRHAIAWANDGRIAALCTAPIHKEALAAAGVPYPGHTEMLAELSGTPDVGMMLVNPRLRTLLATVLFAGGGGAPHRHRAGAAHHPAGAPQPAAHGPPAAAHRGGGPEPARRRGRAVRA